MPKKRKSKSQPKNKDSSGFITRSRILAGAILLIIVGGCFTVYALSVYQTKVVTITDIPSIQASDSDKVSGSAVSTSPPTATTPSSVVTPAPSSDVPTLAPAPMQSTSTTSYQSTNWAGYIATGGNFTAISGTWVVPHPTSTSTTVESGDGTWIGIGGITTSDLIQIGTANTISPSGVVTTSAFYELLPADAVGIASLTVNPGDTVSASISRVTTTVWTIALTDVTSGQTFSQTINYSSSLSSGEWIQEDPSYPAGGLVLLDNFGTVQFTNTTVTMNGTVLSAAASSPSPITLIGQGGAKGHSGTPSGLDGSSFIVKYN